MKKVIRFNENDIEKLVKKIIRENDMDNSEEYPFDEDPDRQMKMEFPEDEDESNTTGKHLNEDDQTGYNIGHIAAEELMDLLDSEGDKDESIVWAFVNGFIENIDDSVLDVVIDAFNNFKSDVPWIR